MIEWVHVRLLDWAEAMMGAGGGVAGHARVSWWGGGSGGDYGARSLVTDAVMDVDEVVRGLPAGPRVAVDEYYLHPDSSMGQKCRAACMSEATLRRNRNRAHALIEAALRR
jgi:hypothetical protein